MKNKVSTLLLLTSLMVLSACGGGTSNSSSGSSAASSGSSSSSTSSSSTASSSSAASSASLSSSSSSSTEENLASIVFNASALSTTTKLQPTTVGAYTASKLTIGSIETTNIYGTGKDYVKFGTNNNAASFVVNFTDGYAITKATVSMAMMKAGSQTVSFSQSASKTVTTATLNSTTFADYTFTYSDATASSTSFQLDVPAAGPVYVASITLTVVAGVEVKAASITTDVESIVDLPMGSTHQIVTTIAPTGVTFPAVTYSVADSTVATVDETGVVTGVAVGSTTVSVTLPAAHSSSGSDIVKTLAVNVIDPNTLLLTSSKDGSTYGGTTKSADVKGTGYASTASKYNYYDVDAAEEVYNLRSTKTQHILVLPIMVRGFESNATDVKRNNIYKTFFGDASDTGWESLASYYWKSSFGQLLLNGTVSEWWDCGYTTSQIKNFTDSEWSSFDPTWRLLQEGISWYKNRYRTDGKEFDLDGDGYFDAVWMVYSAPDYSKDSSLGSTFWAYTFEDFRYVGDPTSPLGHKYCWASYDFMDEGYGLNGCDAHTYIHETGHLLGLQDYYTYGGASNYGPMGKIDMMDNNIIDHNAFSKFAYGWVDPYVVSDSCVITLHPSATTGECVLLPTAGGWNGSAFDEYMMLEFYTPTNLNQKDSVAPYPGNKLQGFTENGVRIYHVDARLCTADYNGSWGSWTLTDEIKFVAPYQDSAKTWHATYTASAFANSDTRQQLKDGIYKECRLLQTMDFPNKCEFK
jgi:M6 family metalloprotease-like protein